MSKLFAKFAKSPNSQATLSPQSAHGESPVRTGSVDSPRTPFPASPSPLRSVAQPKVILTSETSDAATTPTSPGSLHRQSSLGTSVEDAPRKNSLSAAQLKAFADQVAANNGVSVPDDMQTPRAAPLSPIPPAKDQNSTPKANGIRPSPSSEFKSPSHALLPAVNVVESPSVRKQTSAASLTAPPASRSRRGSVASSDAGSTSGRNTQMPTNPPLVESPTQEKQFYASPRTSSEGARSPTRSASKPKPSKTRTWRTRGGSGSAGGIAGALAQSGMSLAHPISPSLTAAAAPPLPSKQPTRAATTASGLPRMPSDNSLAFTGGGILSKTISRGSRGSRSRGHESSDSESYDSEDALSFGPDEIPITGFAVASSKRNADFHELFPNVPDSDYLIEDYGCALQREILIQGRLYISENHMCFNANIFGWITNFIIPFSDVTGLEKKMTAYVIPNAIQICTRTAKYTFASFLSRDTTYDVIHNIWRLSHPRSPNGLESTADLPSTEGPPGAANGSSAHRPTQCACSKEGKHYETVVIDTVMPGTPEKIYNLMFASGFVKDFMAGEQKLTDIQISDWHPEQSGSQLLARNMSYIKPLNGSIGPKSTKCELKDETLHVDFDDYVSTLTTTRTPEVPSGGVFSVKTRTCIMWAGAASSRLVVSTTVEWTGRSFIKSIIDKSAIDGQKQYHTDLEKAMRSYIAAHRTEFIPDDVADAADDSLAVGDTTISPENNTADSAQTKAERARATELRGLQWLLDTFTSASNVAKDSFWGAVDLIGDLMADLPGTTLLGVVVAILVISNIWTMLSLRDAKARVKLDARQGQVMASQPAGGAVVPGVDASEVVKVLLEEVVRGRRERDAESEADPRAEAEALKKSVEALEARVERLKKSLAELD
ncbi:membrane protein [Ceratobasidium sp. AG-Ba]|nr:membrane protein [Ceratobasidium sp. AG-Ba]QRW09192.1 membrane protein [Ceratobasidium sp. AG-Ba]